MTGDAMKAQRGDTVVPFQGAAPNRCCWCGLPMTNPWCDACFPPSQPSREAILRQAILNVAAAKSWVRDARSYLEAVIECHTKYDSAGFFAVAVRAEFAKLVTPCR